MWRSYEIPIGSGPVPRRVVGWFKGFEDLVSYWDFRVEGDQQFLRFTIDWPDMDEPLEDRVRQLLLAMKPAQEYTVRRTSYCSDLCWPPFGQNLFMRFLYEHCLIAVPGRFTVIGSFPDGYRAMLSADEPTDDPNSWYVDADRSLEALVERALDYFETGLKNAKPIPWGAWREPEEHFAL